MYGLDSFTCLHELVSGFMLSTGNLSHCPVHLEGQSDSQKSIQDQRGEAKWMENLQQGFRSCNYGQKRTC